jgi:hypothetical protein
VIAAMHTPRTPKWSQTAGEDFRREVKERGTDERGPFQVLACGHKVRKVKIETHQWCTPCSHRSPHKR